MPLFFLCSLRLVNPPNAALDQNANQVNQPHKGNTDENQDNTDDNTNHILLDQATADTVDHPNDCNCGNAEDQFDQQRKAVKSFNKALHAFLLLKKMYCARILATYIISLRYRIVKGKQQKSRQTDLVYLLS